MGYSKSLSEKSPKCRHRKGRSTISAHELSPSELLYDTSDEDTEENNKSLSRLGRLSAYLFGTCIWAEKAKALQRHHRSRSRRKGADLAGGGARDPSQRGGAAGGGGPCNNGNGVCPVPDTRTTAACTSSQNKKTGVISFSQVGSAKSARKAVQSVDICVADSFDEQMVEKICALPKGLDRNEWLATHVLALFEHVNCISATLSEVCTPVSCSTMSYPGNMKASWVDERGKRHNYSAMRYIDSVMSLCEAARKNQSLFPTKYGCSFCSEFESHCARIVRLLWHCCGHMFSKHWDHLGTLNLRPQFGLVLAHLAKLAKQYSLLPDKELASLNSTLQMARPANTAGSLVESQQQQRPSKRALQDESTGMNATGTVQGRIQQAQQQKKSTQQGGKKDKNNLQQQHHHPSPSSSTMTPVVAMKSGSWGGHSALSVAAAAQNCGELLSNCQKCYAQTC